MPQSYPWCCPGVYVCVVDQHVAACFGGQARKYWEPPKTWSHWLKSVGQQETNSHMCFTCHAAASKPGQAKPNSLHAACHVLSKRTDEMLQTAQHTTQACTHFTSRAHTTTMVVHAPSYTWLATAASTGATLHCVVCCSPLLPSKLSRSTPILLCSRCFSQWDAALLHPLPKPPCCASCFPPKPSTFPATTTIVKMIYDPHHHAVRPEAVALPHLYRPPVLQQLKCYTQTLCGSDNPPPCMPDQC